MSDFVERCRTARYSSNDVREAADEIIRLREKNSRLLAANKDLQAWFDDARADVERMRPWFKPALCEALQRDAGRYRWLRSNPDLDGVVRQYYDGDYDVLQGDELDAAIDAAMEGK